MVSLGSSTISPGGTLAIGQLVVKFRAVFCVAVNIDTLVGTASQYSKTLCFKLDYVYIAESKQ